MTFVASVRARQYLYWKHTVGCPKHFGRAIKSTQAILTTVLISNYKPWLNFANVFLKSVFFPYVINLWTVPVINFRPLQLYRQKIAVVSVKMSMSAKYRPFPSRRSRFARSKKNPSSQDSEIIWYISKTIFSWVIWTFNTTARQQATLHDPRTVISRVQIEMKWEV